MTTLHLRFALALLIGLSSLLLPAQSTVNYLSSTVDFPNPERGFYNYSISTDGPLNQATVEGWRAGYMSFEANYSVRNTLVFRYFMLTDFITSDISAAYLTQMTADFATVRAAGAKLIVRFSYTNTFTTTPPYGDATKSRVLGHIAQLGPVLHDNADVIAAVQLGFIGIYGEGYYTDYFGDASGAGNGFLTAQNWDDRAEIITALLDVLPADRMVQVRYPQQKQKFEYGSSAPTTSAATGGRIGFHNDCFLASDTDLGTFINYDPWSPAHNDQIPDLRNYMAADSETVVVGGETCAANGDVAGDERCASAGGRADTDLELFHYSYLNTDYNNPAVNNQWTSVCLDEIKRRLGYRFELQSGTFPDEARPGQAVALNLSIRNLGYAAPYNPRGIEYVLRNTATGGLYYAVPAADPRQWSAGTTTAIDETFCLPVDLPLGNYDLLLHLPDPASSLYGNPDYSIRLANRLPDSSDPWESSTGFNRLGHTLTVNTTAVGTACAGETIFSSTSPLPVTWLTFTANAQRTGTMLRWNVSAEDNNRGFQVERSTDGRLFDTVSWIDADPVADGKYTYNDDEVLLPTTYYYYRLRQVDWDGRFSYSPLREVRIAGPEQTALLYPNPNDGSFDLIVPGVGRATISIFDSQGKLRLTHLHDFSDGALGLETGLPAGVYYVRCKGTAFSSVSKLVVD